MTARSKKTASIVIKILIPVIFFVLLEIILRVFQYGDQLRLVQTVERDGVRYYQLNADVGQRYFSRIPQNLVPQPYPQTFEYKKSPRTYRIFLLGGSTMAGFPYELNARIDHLLHDRLAQYYPDKKIELINVGLPAINSFSVLDFTRELVDYEPDLFILYMGHNEYYDAYGVGSIEAFNRPGIIRSYHALRKLRLFLLIRNVVQKVTGSGTKTPGLNSDRSLMTAMVQKKSIPFKSKEYDITKQYYAENLERIIKIAKKNDVPIMISTLLSNLRGQKPYDSVFSDTLSNENRQKWDRLFQQGKQLYQVESYVKSLSSFENAMRIDSNPAMLHYEVGNLFLIIGDSARAKQSFKLARDLDPVRFRAPTEFNRIIKKLCRSNRVPLLDMEAIFSNFSPYHIIGNELVSEYVYPNFRGYFLMAKSFARAMIEYNFLNRRAQNLAKTDDEFLEISAVTILDRAIGDVKIQQLTSESPYEQPVSIIQYKIPEVKQIVEAIAKDYFNQKISWDEAHYRLAEYFIRAKSPDLAIAEYKPVIKIFPDNYFLYFKIGNLYFTQDNQAGAEKWFKMALERNKEAALIHAKLGMVYVKKRNYNEAIKYFQQALNLDHQKNQLSEKEKIYSYYYLAACFIETDQLAEAKSQLQKLLEIDPEHKQARLLLSLMAQNKKIFMQF